MAKKTSPTTINTPAFYRLGTISRAADYVRADGDDAAARTFELSFSSEAEYERYYGVEILGHEGGEIRMDWLAGGTAPLLLDHDRTQVLGVIENSVIGDDRKGRAVVRFGKSAFASEIMADIDDGIRSNVSVGYRVHKLLLTEEREDLGVYRATDWEPFEISMVSVPADTTVGLGRNDAAADHVTTILNPKENAMTPEEIEAARLAAEVATRAAAPAPVPAVPTDVAAAVRDARNAETTRVTEVLELGARHGFSEQAKTAVSDGTTVDTFRAFVLDNMKDATPAEARRAEDPEIGLTTREAQSFSYVRALNAIANPSDRFAQEAAKFEREASDAAGQKLGRTAQGLFVPVDVLRNAGPDMVRDLNVGTATAGGNLVGTDLQSGSFIDLLRKKASVFAAGATMLSGLNGDIAIPKQTGAATGYWVTEGNAPTESQQTLGQIALTPKTVGAFTDYTRKLLLQSSIDVEAFIRDDLAQILALQIDLKALYGTGASGQPTGVSQTSGINAPTAFAAPAPTFAEIVAMESAIASSDADIGNMQYMFNGNMRGGFKTTEKFSSTGMTIWEQGGTVNGYQNQTTNQVTEGDVFFGVWSQLVVGMWGGLDLTVDPYTSSTTGTVRIVALQSADTAIRQAAAFSFNNDT